MSIGAELTRFNRAFYPNSKELLEEYQLQTYDLKERIERLNNPHVPETPFGVFITTNESTDFTTSLLSKGQARENGCHIGFSGWHNFTVMAMRKSSYGVICDINPESTRFMQETLKAIQASENIGKFLENMERYFYQQREIHFADNPLAAIQADFQEDLYYSPTIELFLETTRPESWLYTEERFQHIKKLALERKISLFTEDILHTKPFQSLKKILQEKGLVVDTLYLSNIAHFINDDELTFANTVLTLVDPDTLVIHCPRILERTSTPTYIGYRGGLFPQDKQVISTGRELQKYPVRCFSVRESILT